MKTLDVLFCRVYFNRDEHPTKAWSVDFGKGTCEFVCGRVILEQVTGVARFEPRSGDGSGAAGADTVSPRAWFEFEDVTIVLHSGEISPLGAGITIRRML